MILKNISFYSLPLVCSMTKYVSYMEGDVLKLVRETPPSYMLRTSNAPPQIMRLKLNHVTAFQSYSEASFTEDANKLAAVYLGLTQKTRAELKFINDFNIATKNIILLIYIDR